VNAQHKGNNDDDVHISMHVCYVLPLEVFADFDVQRPRFLGTNFGVGFTKARVLNRSCITAETRSGAVKGAGNTTDCVCGVYMRL